MNIKRKTRTAAEETANSLRGSILRGEMPPGSALPAERDLARRLGVSRLTLRSAITRLETEGLVQPVQGSGTRVLNYREEGGVGLIAYLAAQALEGGTVPEGLLRDLLEVRRMIAVELVALVAERASDDELRELRRHHAVMATLEGDPEAFKNAD
ncbi:MAG: FadR family transcriptional regulator, partial [Deltaproteobacteria bacterium]|nr:FadR family transcriptional regulator [Deltaproteobacteria bacterium]